MTSKKQNTLNNTNATTATMILRTLLLLSLLLVASLAEKEVDRHPEAALLMAAMASGDQVEEVAAALEDGADIDVVDKRSGQTPLMAAVLRGKLEIVKLLLKKGADVTLGEKDGYTPAHGAAFQGRSHVMKALQEHGIDVVHDQHEDGFYPFHRACWGKKRAHTLVVEYLLEQGADINLEGGDGRRCIEMTKNKNTKALLKKLNAEPSREPEDEDEL
jgi:ankyrin repeat protein